MNFHRYSNLLYSAVAFAKPSEMGSKSETVDNQTGEVTDANLPATIDNESAGSISERATAKLPVGLGVAGAKLMIGGREITVARQVTIPTLRQEDMALFAVRFEEPIHIGEELKNSRGGGAKMAPANIAKVTNLATGILNILICNTVLQAELDRVFPNATYVGKYLAFQRYENPNAKVAADGSKERSYKRYDILELEAGDFAGVVPAAKL